MARLRIIPLSENFCETLVIVLACGIIASLSFAVFFINYWPTDSYNPYIPTAAQLFKQRFLSNMHDIPVQGQLKIVMHGKEVLILGIALMQSLLGDRQSLFPNILLLILAHGLSMILVYFVFRKIFDTATALSAFLFFSFSFWPYLYILQGAHQPLVLMNFLVSVSFLLSAGEKSRRNFLSGIFLGLMLFSSPTAPLYLPYWLAAFIFSRHQGLKKKPAVYWGKDILPAAAGALLIFVWLTFPHPLENMKQKLRFLNFSQSGNNFVIYRSLLQSAFPLPFSLKGGGALWVIKYFFLIMPVLFPLFLVSVFFLLRQSLEMPIRKMALLQLLLLTVISTPLLVDFIGVVQFGRNYFSWFIGILLTVSLAFSLWKRLFLPSLKPKTRKAVYILIGLFLAGHIFFNVTVFVSDILPSRMATTSIHDWLVKAGQKKVYIHGDHPLYKNFAPFLNNPRQGDKITVIPIDNIRQVQDGYILLPPITGKCIYVECRYQDFWADLYLTDLFYSGRLGEFVAAPFKTLASSKIWTQEEEICTYLDLIIRGISPEERNIKGRAYLLDGRRLQEEWFAHLSTGFSGASSSLPKQREKGNQK